MKIHPVFWFMGGGLLLAWFFPALFNFLGYIAIGLFILAMIREHLRR